MTCRASCLRTGCEALQQESMVGGDVYDVMDTACGPRIPVAEVQARACPCSTPPTL
jgi:hypothetical protein